MKKVMILSAAILALSYATPQVANAMKIQNQIANVQVKEVVYQEIKVTEIPEAISASITADYAGNTIDKAFYGDNATYKVMVSKGDVKQALLFSADGKFIKVEEPATK